MTIPIVLVSPWVDPPDTFRATKLSDLYYIVPSLASFSSFEYNVGVPQPETKKIFSIQNRTVSHILRVDLTLPPYLRSNLGSSFYIAPIGDTTPPVADVLLNDLNFFGVGMGLINLTITFEESQMIDYVPVDGGYNSSFAMNIYPIGVSGPVYVKNNVPIPEDLNNTDEEAPIDGTPTDNTPDETKIVEVPIIVEKEVPVPDNKLRWRDGTTGEIKEGSPPDGWTTAADGAAYPPLVDPCTGDTELPEIGTNPVTGRKACSLGKTRNSLDECQPVRCAPGNVWDDTQNECIRIEDQDFVSPLEMLVIATEYVPAREGSSRIGANVNPFSYLLGGGAISISNECVSMVVCTIGPTEADFAILNHSAKTVEGIIVDVPQGNWLTSGIDPFSLYVLGVADAIKASIGGEILSLGHGTDVNNWANIIRSLGLTYPGIRDGFTYPDTITHMAAWAVVNNWDSKTRLMISDTTDQDIRLFAKTYSTAMSVMFGTGIIPMTAASIRELLQNG